MSNKLFLPIILILYGLSLYLPGIIFELSLQDNEKYGFCASAMKDDRECVKSATGHQCSLIEAGEKRNPQAMSRQQVGEYCGHDWNTPIPKTLRGYEILLQGWLGFFIFNFAWWGNPLFIIAFISTWRNKYRNAVYSSVSAFAFGVSALALYRVPRNEGRVNDYIVDHLGLGYYLWMLVIIFTGLYAYVLWKRENDQTIMSSLKLIALTVVATILVAGPTFFIGYMTKERKMGMEAIVDQMGKLAAEEERKQADNLMNPFIQTFAKGNYKVTIQENGLVVYFEKGVLVRVGEPYAADPSKKYYIAKNNKVYAINAAKKMFVEMDVKDEIGKKEWDRMNGLSTIGSVIQMEEQNRNLWSRTDNIQIISLGGTKIEATFDMGTTLLSRVVMSVSQGGKNETLTRSFRYEEISDQEMDTAKKFPLDYRKVDSI